jgi:hypothetical protein
MKFSVLKEKICAVLGWLSIVGGTLYGLWLCIYHMFYGGILQIIYGIQNGGEAIAIATGICKIVFCEFGLGIPMILGLLIGAWFLDKSDI